MTFGQQLKQMLSVCGIRVTYFANALGYDSSYVSRWISDTSAPSLKNNSDLFAKIASVIISCCNDKEREQLAHEYCPQNPALLSETLELLLTNAYVGRSKSDADVSLMEKNAVYQGGGSVEVGHECFRKAFMASAEACGGGIIECICGTPLSMNGNVTIGFFATVLQKEAGRSPFKIHVRQIIDMNDFENNIDTCCAAICTFVKYDPDVFYTFYEYDNPADAKQFKSYMLINNTMLHFVFHNPLTDANDYVVSFDAGINSREYKRLRTRMEFMTKLLKKCGKEDTEDVSQFLYNYAMDSGTRYFLDYMQPIYITRELLETLRLKFFPDETSDGFAFRYSTICENVQKEVIVYSSALLNYIYSGNIFLLGSRITLSVEERIEHLEQLKGDINSGKCDLYILSDTNPLLNRDDTRVSFYLSCKSGFMTSSNEDERPIMLFRSTRTVALFNEFFSHFTALDQKYISHGERSLEFITRGIDILKSLNQGQKAPGNTSAATGSAF